uniref:Uncharacterized protein n=1 Tax=Trichobilharzia regenti TaxID=157069 RepID=A0AA85IW98_TRIRE|nr:unnamed protein product [Trichobilharzia regenti]
MRYFLLFITSFILLHVQQSTQDKFKNTMMKTLIRNKLKWNSEDLRKNNVTLTTLKKELQSQTENINIRLSPGGLSVNKYIACRTKLMEEQTGVELMKSMVENIRNEENFEIFELINKMNRFYREISTQTKTLFQQKLYMHRSNELDKLISKE